MRTLRADVEPDGQFWFIRLPDLDGVNGSGTAFTQARTRDEIIVMATDLAALLLEVDHAEITIVAVDVPPSESDDS